MAGRFANAFKRSTTEEREARRRRQAEEKKGLGRSKTLNSRMDIIDQLDISGIHGTTMFHHDSPYDACTPHANRSSKKAPVKAFDPNVDQLTGMSISQQQQHQQQQQQRANGNRRGLSPLAASTLQKMDDHDDGKDAAHSQRPESSSRGRSNTAPLGTVPTLSQTGRMASASSTASGAPATPGVNGLSSDASSVATESSSMDGDVDAERQWRQNQGYYTQPSKTPKSRADVSNPMADVWGVSSEPWQDFAQPAGKPRSSRPSGANKNGGASGSGSRGGGKGLSPYGMAGSYNNSRDGPPSAASSVLDMESVMTGKTAEQRRREAEAAAGEIAGVSPFPEPDYDRLGGGDAAASSARDGGGPKRSKSLIKRIKSARQYGNVPPPDEDVLELSGRRQAAAAAKAHRHSPSTPPVFYAGGSPGESPAVGGSGSLGRSGTRKATREEQLRAASYGATGSGSGGDSGSASSAYHDGASNNSGASGGAFLSPTAGYDADEQRGRSNSGGNSPTSPSAGGAGVGRSGSIFGRFGRKKSGDGRTAA